MSAPPSASTSASRGSAPTSGAHASGATGPVASGRPLEAVIAAVAVIGPGLPDWVTAAPILRGEAPWPTGAQDLPVPLPPALGLPPAERRRVGAPVKLALGVATQLFAQTAIAAAETASIFTSSSGDGETCHALSTALLEPEPVLSPTRFTNSVHNAVAGYWSIAVGAMAPSSALCAHDGSFCAGLLEALAFTAVERQPVALIAFEVPYPEPIHGARPIPAPFAVALLLQPLDPEEAGPATPATEGTEASGAAGANEATGATGAAGGAAKGAALADPPLARLRAHPPMIAASAHVDQNRGATAATPIDGPGLAALDALRRQVPAARSLPLLAALARGEPTSLLLDAGADRLLRIDVGPWA